MNLPRLSNGDPGSFSNPEDVIVSHMDLFLNVDFSNETFSGYVTLTAVIKNSTATELILDSRNLHVEKITSPNDDIELSYAFGESIHTFGRKLTVKLPQPVSEKLLVKIEYHTDPGATALYWLKPHQTVGGKHPFVFSQCQPDHCRSIIPCQDSPGVKGTYNAIVTVLSEELRVVMSAMQLEELNAERNVKPEFRFSQTIPIPAYLIAIAVGNLEKRKIGPCSTVWTEPEIINEAEYEFKEIDLLLKTAEDICGPYVWTIYDIVVLPPSFPFGGMENSCVTFVTPTVLVGDRSLLYVIAHEISHSWSGNLVSAKNFEHFWLNEGFATFIERKIGGRLKGEAYRQFRAIGGIRELRLTVKALGEDNPFTQLVVDLTGIDPDDTFSNVVYEKGHTFLFYLEQLLGGPEKFERFLRSYFREFERQAIDTNNFKLCLLTFYRGTKNLKLIDWDQWLYSTGMPYIIPEYDNSLQIPCILLVERWIKWQQNTPHSFRETDLKSFMSEQVEEFLALLLEKIPLPVPKLRLMNHLYKMNSFKNSEIRVRWLRICIQSRWMEQMDLALNFATEQKQVKYVCPIFRDLFSWQESRDKAIQKFNDNKFKMAPLLVDNIFKFMKDSS